MIKPSLSSSSIRGELERKKSRKEEKTETGGKYSLDGMGMSEETELLRSESKQAKSKVNEHDSHIANVTFAFLMIV